MTPNYISAQEHQISSDKISKNAITVIKTLTQHGFLAYLVGGGIRDLLSGMHPKDFDISTNARPEEVVRLFKRARVIGRRFKIAHVYFGKEVIEVTTFRGNHPEELDNHPHAKKSTSGQLLRDNIYGSLEEDAIRRDFTVNSLYYDFDSNQLIDYTGAFDDLKSKTLRIIGDPEKRYREDPVRMLRAIRFAAKLGFTIEARSADPIFKLAELLLNIPPARLFDECLKLFLSGTGERAFELANHYQLFSYLFPDTSRCLNEHGNQQLVELALRNTDKRIAAGKGTTPAFLFAVMLWSPLQQCLAQHTNKGMRTLEALHKAKHQVVATQMKHTSIPRRFSLPMRDIWDLQYRLDRRGGSRAYKLLAHPRFRAAYDFLLLREQSLDKSVISLPNGLGQWWTEFQDATTDQRSQMISILGKGKGKGRRKRTRKNTRLPQTRD